MECKKTSSTNSPLWTKTLRRDNDGEHENNVAGYLFLCILSQIESMQWGLWTVRLTFPIHLLYTLQTFTSGSTSGAADLVYGLHCEWTLMKRLPNHRLYRVIELCQNPGHRFEHTEKSIHVCLLFTLQGGAPFIPYLLMKDEYQYLNS